jgi:hypothetical protein
MLLATAVAAAVTAATTTGSTRTAGAGGLPAATATIAVTATLPFTVFPKFTSAATAPAILPFTAATTTALLLRLAATVTHTATLPWVARRHGCRCGGGRLFAGVLAGRRHEVGSPRPVGFLGAGALLSTSAVVRTPLRLGATIRPFVTAFGRE